MPFICFLFFAQLLMIWGTSFPEILQDDPHKSTNLNDNDDEEHASMQSINQILQDLLANANG